MCFINSLLYASETEFVQKKIEKELEIPDPTLEEAVAAITDNSKKDGEDEKDEENKEDEEDKNKDI